MRLGIISALHEEQQGLVEAMERPYKLIHGMREYWGGNCGKSTLWPFYRVLARLPLP
jgi:hypothetical protein